jgi:hypothetical protein
MSVSIVGPFPPCNATIRPDTAAAPSVCGGTLLPKVSIDWAKNWRGKLRAIPETQVLLWECSFCHRRI